MSAYHVLLFEGRARQSLPLAKGFKEIGCEVTALCAHKYDVSYVSRFVDHKVLGVCDNTREKETAAQVIELVKTGCYNLVVPTTDFSATVLSKYKNEILPYAQVASNDWNVFRLAENKNETMNICQQIGVPCPKTVYRPDSVDSVVAAGLMYPIVVKPAVGYGAIGFKKVSSETELRTICAEPGFELSQNVFQEYIPQTDIQYECAMFMDDNDEVKTSVVFSKNRWFPVEGGSSTLNITVERPDIVASCEKLLKAIHWRGACDIDLIQDPRDNTAKIMEINPRVSGSVKICYEAGVNQSRQMMELSQGNEVTDYPKYRIGQRLRCSQTDLLWFIKSPNRFKSEPSWFSIKNTKDQIFYLRDPLPYFAFSLHGLFSYKEEMAKRRSE